MEPYLDDLIARYASELDVVKVPAQDLVSFVERGYLGSSEAERRSAVEPYVRHLLDKGADRIVLACTHFLHLERDIAECAAFLGASGVEIVDSRAGVAKQLARGLWLAVAAGGERRAASLSGALPLTGNRLFGPLIRSVAERFGSSAGGL